MNVYLSIKIDVHVGNHITKIVWLVLGSQIIGHSLPGTVGVHLAALSDTWERTGHGRSLCSGTREMCPLHPFLRTLLPLLWPSHVCAMWNLHCILVLPEHKEEEPWSAILDIQKTNWTDYLSKGGPNQPTTHVSTPNPSPSPWSRHLLKKKNHILISGNFRHNKDGGSDT